MRRPCFGAVALLVALLTMNPQTSPQEAEEYESVDNPFHAGYSYRIGDDLSPGVEIDGIRWRQIRVQPKEGKEIESGKAIPTTISLSFENTTNRTATAAVIILFEDSHNIRLDRIVLEPVRIGDLRTKEAQQKYKIQGDVLSAAAQLYLFCEIQR